jgi:type I protein arginine methyltransferase
MGPRPGTAIRLPVSIRTEQAIYLLALAEDSECRPTIEPIPQHQALMALMDYTHVPYPEVQATGICTHGVGRCCGSDQQISRMVHNMHRQVSHGYTISQFGKMYMDKARMSAYTAALRAAVTPDSVVLDIGAGTGIFALLACRYGARRVYAIEPDNAINLAREIAAANGYSDRLTCIQDVSTKVTLPERANVIISDLGGMLPVFKQHIPAIMDARDRFLVPGGALIPQQDHLRAAIIEAPDIYPKLLQPWGENLFGLDLRAGWPLVANTYTSLPAKQAKLLTGPSTLVVLDYRTIADSDMDVWLSWTTDQPGTGHGAAVWFDRIVADGIEISSGPGAPEAINVFDVYGSAFFPWPNPIDLEPGDRVSFRMKANLVNDEDYLWRWETTIHTGGCKQDTKANFRQSSLNAVPVSLEFLKKREAGYVPAPNEDARIDAFILSKIDGHTTLRQIAYGLAAAFPSRFNGWLDALTRVGEMTAQYGER